MKTKRFISMALLFAMLFSITPLQVKAFLAPPPADMFQLPWEQGKAWVSYDGFDNGTKRLPTSPHNYQVGGAVDFAPRVNMQIGEDTSNDWVTAAAAGRVIEISFCHLKLDHGNGWITEYWHLNNIQVNLGQNVSRNQRLGIIHNNQNQQVCLGNEHPGPHLHFVVRPKMQEFTFAGWVINYNSKTNLTTFVKNGQTVGRLGPLLNIPNLQIVSRGLLNWDTNENGSIDPYRYERWTLPLTEQTEFTVTLTTPTTGLLPVIVLLNSGGVEITRASGTLTTMQPAGTYYIQIQADAGTGFYDLIAIRDASSSGTPTASATPTVDLTQFPETATPTIDLTQFPETATPTVDLTQFPETPTPTADLTQFPETPTPTIDLTLFPATATPTPNLTLTPATITPTVDLTQFPATATQTIDLTQFPATSTSTPIIMTSTVDLTQFPATATPTFDLTQSPATATIDLTQFPSTATPTFDLTQFPATATFDLTQFPVTSTSTVDLTQFPETSTPTIDLTQFPVTATSTLVPLPSETPISTITATPTLMLTPTNTAIPTPGGPYVLTDIIPSTIIINESTLVTVSLLNVPASGYASAEITCSYNPVVLEASNIMVANLFGDDPASAIYGPQNGSFIVAIAGSNGNRAMTDGVTFTFNVTGLSVGQSNVECIARVSTGGTLENIAFIPDSLTVLGEQPSPTPIVIPDAMVNGQVLAGKPVTVQLFDLDDNLIASVNADANGVFIFSAPEGIYTISASADGYLKAQAMMTLGGGDIVTMPTISLPAGDINGNGVIDQFDALTIGMNYNLSAPEIADLNNDGVINILDAELLAANYRLSGPVAWQ